MLSVEVRHVSSVLRLRQASSKTKAGSLMKLREKNHSMPRRQPYAKAGMISISRVLMTL